MHWQLLNCEYIILAKKLRLRVIQITKFCLAKSGIEDIQLKNEIREDENTSSQKTDQQIRSWIFSQSFIIQM